MAVICMPVYYHNIIIYIYFYSVSLKHVPLHILHKHFIEKKKKKNIYIYLHSAILLYCNITRCTSLHDWGCSCSTSYSDSSVDPSLKVKRYLTNHCMGDPINHASKDILQIANLYNIVDFFLLKAMHDYL